MFQQSFQFSDGGDSLVLALFAPARGATVEPWREPAYEALHGFHARRVLERLVWADPSLLARVYSALVTAFDVRRVPTTVMLATLLREARVDAPDAADNERAGARLRMFRQRLRSTWSNERQKPPAAAPVLTGRSPKAEQHAITFLLSTSDGAPVPDVLCEVISPDQQVRVLSSDPDGVIYVGGIPAGSCRLRLLKLDGSTWRAAGGAPSLYLRDEPARTHVAAQGDCLSRIARRYGQSDWRKVWNRAENAELRERRKSPHVLLPGDKVVVPGLSLYELVRDTDASHRVLIEGSATTTVRLRVQDMAREPFANLKYELAYALGTKEERRPGSAPTDADGWLNEELPVDAQQVVVHFKKPPLSFQLEIGHLDPVRDDAAHRAHLRGVQQRLRALGFRPDGLASTDEAAVGKLSLRTFQAEELSRAQPGGELDDETLDALTRAYGA